MERNKLHFALIELSPQLCAVAVNTKNQNTIKEANGALSLNLEQGVQFVLEERIPEHRTLHSIVEEAISQMENTAPLPDGNSEAAAAHLWTSWISSLMRLPLEPLSRSLPDGTTKLGDYTREPSRPGQLVS